MAASSQRPVAKISCRKEAKKNTSALGLINTCSPATLAVSVRRGSITMILPPLAFTSFRRLTGWATCRKVHLETTGLVPTTSMHST